MDLYLKIGRVVFLIVGIFVLVRALITGKMHFRGGQWITTKSFPNNPVIRSDTPRDFWFAWSLAVFIFAMLMFGLFMAL